MGGHIGKYRKRMFFIWMPMEGHIGKFCKTMFFIWMPMEGHMGTFRKTMFFIWMPMEGHMGKYCKIMFFIVKNTVAFECVKNSVLYFAPIRLAIDAIQVMFHMSFLGFSF